MCLQKDKRLLIGDFPSNEDLEAGTASLTYIFTLNLTILTSRLNPSLQNIIITFHYKQGEYGDRVRWCSQWKRSFAISWKCLGEIILSQKWKIARRSNFAFHFMTPLRTGWNLYGPARLSLGIQGFYSFLKISSKIKTGPQNGYSGRKLILKICEDHNIWLP